MPEGEDYKAKYPDTLRQKLFIPRDKEGAVQKEMLELVRWLQRELGSQEGFVGVAPFGSTVYGYGNPPHHPENDSNHPSDIDVAVFYDSSEHAGIEKRLEKIAYLETGLRWRADQRSVEVHIPSRYMFDIRLDTVDRMLEQFQGGQQGTENSESRRFFLMLHMLSLMAVGPGVDRYRAAIGTKIAQLDLSTQNYILRQIAAQGLLREDGSRTDGMGSSATVRSKRNERMLSGMQTAEIDALRDDRRRMWENRVRKVYGIT